MATDPVDAPFSIHILGETTERTWAGEFRAKKRLSHRDHLRKDQVRRTLLGGEPGIPSDRAEQTARIFSELAVRLTQAPPWWTDANGGVDLEDDNVIVRVHDEAIRIENEAIEAKKKRAEKVQEELRAQAAKEAEVEK